jgi:hypothetical protein
MCTWLAKMIDLQMLGTVFILMDGEADHKLLEDLPVF